MDWGLRIMPMKPEREYRQALTIAALTGETPKRISSNYYVEGYAALYEKYPLYDFGDGDIIYERFEPGCFDGADMSDVIMQYDHEGRVFARISNGSLIVEPDEKGLFIAADLSRTDGAKDLYGDISAGMITKMSWCFRTGEWAFVKEENCYVHHSVKKIYDVSAVSIPANDSTSINARGAGFPGGVIGKAAEEFRAAQLEVRRRRLILMTI